MKPLKKNKLNILLYKEFSNIKPNENKIRELLAKGANINALDMYNENLLMQCIGLVNCGLELKYIQLLIELGIDVNYAEPNSFNCLYLACLTQKTELVEMLLKAGANPNCIYADWNESLLDWAEFELSYFSNYPELHDETERNSMIKIIELLKKHEAKKLKEIHNI